MSPFKLIIFIFLDAITIINLMDYFTWHIQSTVTMFWCNILLSLSYNQFLRAALFGWMVYRIGSIAWRRYKVNKCLVKKHESLLDKHSRLHTKFQGLEKKNEPDNIDNDKLTQLSVAQIRQQLRQGQLKAIDVLDAYQIHALGLFRSRLNCISEIIFEADVYAFIVDPMLQDSNANLTPIHGLPIALEEVFPIRGYDHTMGFVTCANKPAEDDCILVQALKECGAIPFILTNSKRKFMSLKAENPIFGLTKHPTHSNRCCVNGAAVLVAQNGTPLAIGTDLLGETRLAAAFCGKVGFKPTPQRMTQKTMCLPIGLPEILGPVASPIGHRVDDVADVLRSLWTSALFQLDRSLFPAYFDENKYTKGAECRNLRIGYFTDFDDLIEASCGPTRIVEEVIKYLQGQGHEMVPFKVPNPGQTFKTTINLLASFMEPELLRLIYQRGDGDVYEDYRQRLLHFFYALPKFIKKELANRRAQKLEDEYPVTSLVLKGLACDGTYCEMLNKAHDHMNRFFTAWNDDELDLLICPVAPIPAPWNNCLSYTVNCVLLYTSLFNLFGCPAGTVSVGQVNREDTEFCQEKASKELDEPRWRRTWEMYAAQYKEAEGLPIGIQVVGKPWDDELVLGMLKNLESKSK